MKITQEVRDFAAKQGAEGAAADPVPADPQVIAQGLREKAEEFKRAGGELYVRPSP
jgi:phosphomethylpyrimidine synthase